MNLSGEPDFRKTVNCHNLANKIKHFTVITVLSSCSPIVISQLFYLLEMVILDQEDSVLKKSLNSINRTNKSKSIGNQGTNI